MLLKKREKELASQFIGVYTDNYIKFKVIGQKTPTLIICKLIGENNLTFIISRKKLIENFIKLTNY